MLLKNYETKVAGY